jgi:hypothetical protein
MFRRVLIFEIAMVFVLLDDCASHADELDARINLELAFRDSILEQPAPRHYQALIRDGETTITFVRDLPATVGKTEFFLSMDWSYEFRVATEAIDGVTQVAVTPMNVKVTPRLRHVIRMPIGFYHAEVWKTPLLGHEFDHVAVSLDPRPRALLVHLCSNLPVYRFAQEGEGKPSSEQMRAGIDRELQRRQEAILELLQANYMALDKASTNGREAMQARTDFFESLYTRENLAATAFPFLDEVASILDSDSYKRLHSRHVPADPFTLPQR